MRKGFCVGLFLFLIVVPGLAQRRPKPGPMPLLPAALPASLEAPSVPAVSLPSQELQLAPAKLQPMMPAGVALETYESRLVRQSRALSAYTAHEVIEADLPDSSQHGRYELTRRYLAPRTLEFKPLAFTGDGFVKGNVMHRLMQAEVEHVEKQRGPETALNSQNYKFSYKGLEQLEGATVHVFQVKPRKKRQGLFKGKMFLDSYTGSLRRAEGKLVKNPSFFIKKLEFVQDYTDVGEFTFPVRIQSEAKVRLIGRAIVRIFTGNYQAAPVVQTASAGQP